MTRYFVDAAGTYLGAFDGIHIAGEPDENGEPTLTYVEPVMFGVTDHTALQISGSLALLKLVINAVRDGPSGMVAPPKAATAWVTKSW